MLVLTKEGSKIVLSSILNNDLVLHLYNNDNYPNSDTIFTDFTEPKGAGYFPINIIPKKWNIFANNAGFYEGEYPTQKFTFIGPLGPIYGYFITKFNTNIVIWAKRFNEGPFKIVNSGDFIEIEPKFSLHK